MYTHSADPLVFLFVCRQVLSNADENAMVRHEAAEALGAIASPECLEILTQYAQQAHILAQITLTPDAGTKRTQSAWYAKAALLLSICTNTSRAVISSTRMVL